jgi:hypothetical protein
MNKKIIILILPLLIVLTISYFYFSSRDNSINISVASIREDNQLRNNVIEIETTMALTHAMKMSFDELINKTEPYIHTYYKETYFDELKKVYETHNLIPYLTKPPYYQYISKVYSNDDDSVKQVYVKSTEISAIDSSTLMPVKDTRSQSAKLYTFKKENEQWKVLSVTNYHLSIDRNKPKQIIERFTNYNNTPIEYELIKILDSLN